VQCEISNITIGRAIWEASSATWNLGTNSAFALGPRKTLIELAGHRTFRMQLISSQQSSIKSTNPNISPYSLLLYFSFLVFFPFLFSQVILFLQLRVCVCAYDLDKKHIIQNTYGRKQTRIHTYIYLYPIVVWKSDVLQTKSPTATDKCLCVHSC
jgi:hypothetical protein